MAYRHVADHPDLELAALTAFVFFQVHPPHSP